MSEQSLFYILGNLFLDRLAIETSLDDGSVRAEEDDVRNAHDTVKVCRYILGIYNLIPVYAISLSRIEALLCGFLPNGHAEHVEIFSVILVIDSLHVRDLMLARTAP